MSNLNSRPNILLIMIESWDGRVIGCLGDPALKNVTPNVDKLASEGTLFRNAYTSHPICCPARANMWSGMYTFNCESWNNYKGLKRGTPILKDVMKEAGYKIASEKGGIGKHDYTDGNHTNQARITAWTGAANIRLPSYIQGKPKIQFPNVKKVHTQDWIDIKRAKNFIKKQVENGAGKGGDPFFLYLSLRAPHPRFRTTKKWLSKVDYDKVSIPPKDKSLHPVIEFQRISKDWKWGFDPKVVKNTRAIYYGMVAETDAMIGEIIEKVNELGIRDNTFIILTADHGENNMEHELWYKSNMYDSSAKVPLIISGPGVQKGKKIDNMASLVDLYPTILDMANVEISKAPNKLDGQSLLPLVKGETDQSRPYAFSMYTSTAANTSMYMYRKDDWKYIAYPGYEPQLFNLRDDPDEIDDLSNKRPEIVSQLDAELLKVVDYPAVHKKWQKYCKKAFLEYREKVRAKPIPLFEYGAMKRAATYDEVMANTYKGWTKDHEIQLEKWLESIED